MFSPSNLRLKITTVNFVQIFIWSKHPFNQQPHNDKSSKTLTWYVFPGPWEDLAEESPVGREEEATVSGGAVSGVPARRGGFRVGRLGGRLAASSCS